MPKLRAPETWTPSAIMPQCVVFVSQAWITGAFNWNPSCVLVFDQNWTNNFGLYDGFAPIVASWETKLLAQELGDEFLRYQEQAHAFLALRRFKG